MTTKIFADVVIGNKGYPCDAVIPFVNSERDRIYTLSLFDKPDLVSLPEDNDEFCYLEVNDVYVRIEDHGFCTRKDKKAILVLVESIVT